MILKGLYKVSKKGWIQDCKKIIYLIIGTKFAD